MKWTTRPTKNASARSHMRLASEPPDFADSLIGQTDWVRQSSTTLETVPGGCRQWDLRSALKSPCSLRIMSCTRGLSKLQQNLGLLSLLMERAGTQLR